MQDRDDRRPVETGAHRDDGAGGANESDPQLVFLEELVEEHATIAGDIIEIDSHTWAIHGFIAVDGEVIMAEYESEEHARVVLDELSAEQRAQEG
jgi:hypothetical protein